MRSPSVAEPARHPLIAYVVVAAAWAATRTFAIVTVDLTPWNLNDLRVYQSWLPWFAVGRFPATDPMWQYPPGVAPIITVADALPLSFRWGFTAVMLAFDAGILIALLVAHRRRRDASWRGPGLWAGAGLVVGSILLARFDVAPTFFAVLAVLLAARPAKGLLAGGAAALGAVVKVWPALMLLAVPRRTLGRAAAGFAAATIVVLGAAAATTSGSLSFLHNQGARGLQLESVGALPYLIRARLTGTHLPTGLRYGSIQVIAAGTERVGLIVTVVGVVALGAVVYLRLRGRLEAVPPGDVALVAILVAVASSRVYSPQFDTWLVGVAAVAMLDRASRMVGPTVLVVVVSLVTQVVYPWRMSQLVLDDPLTTWLQAVRIVLLLVATGWALWAIWPRGRRRAAPTA